MCKVISNFNKCTNCPHCYNQVRKSTGQDLSGEDDKINEIRMTKKGKKAIIFDLDNTIYPVSSIAEKLFSDLYKLIEQDRRYSGNLETIKESIQKKPFQVVSKEFNFNESLTSTALELLSGIEYNDTIVPFEDYVLTKDIDCLKFLVTTGFTKLQWSKINKLELQQDFEACYVVDPTLSELTKKDIFRRIMEKYRLTTEEVLVIGDDIHSEIKAGKELGIETVVYDYEEKYTQLSGYNIISSYNKLQEFI